MSDKIKHGEPLDEMDLQKATGGSNWDEEIEFVCPKCKRSITAIIKPKICPKCNEKM